MSDVGNNYFMGVMFPVVFGDRFLRLDHDPFTGAHLVDVYRWERDRERLVVEVSQGRPLPGAPPFTVTPVAGRGGGVRLGVGTTGGLVGYLSGGDDPRSITITGDEITVLEGDRPIVRMSGNSIMGAAIGLHVRDDGSVTMGSSLPPDLPTRRTFENAAVYLPDLVRPRLAEGPDEVKIIGRTDFERCHIIGPAIVAALDALSVSGSVFPRGAFLWAPPAESGVHGIIGLSECAFRECEFDNVGFVVAANQHEAIMAGIRGAGAS